MRNFKNNTTSMTAKFLALIALTGGLTACSSGASSEPNESFENVEQTFQNKAHELVYEMVQTTGTYGDLLKKKDVIYTYSYTTPDGKNDRSTEKYLFKGELSYGLYVNHERTLPELTGEIEQSWDGSEFWLKNEGELIEDEKALDRVKFNRSTNFYWFTMMQKLLDPGIKYELLNDETVDGVDYNVVKIMFVTNDEKPTDIYQLYINKETSLVDQFLFTVADFGKMEIPNLMRMEYEEIDGMMIPTKRKYKKSTWKADVTDEPWIEVLWSDIKFNNGLTKENFKKENTMMIKKEVSLQALLDEKKAGFELKASEEKKRIYQEGFDAVEKSGVLNRALNVGDVAPNFVLKNAIGEKVALSDYLKKGKVVLTWYRGGWCPYCNITLNQLQQELPEFIAAGANLIALTPELPDRSITTAEKHALEFEVLSDLGNKVARNYGIVFRLTDDVAKAYNEAFDMNGYNGDKSNELPLAATYVIGQDGKIEYAFLDIDYRKRAEPSDITAFLKK